MELRNSLIKEISRFRAAVRERKSEGRELSIDHRGLAGTGIERPPELR